MTEPARPEPRRSFLWNNSGSAAIVMAIAAPLLLGAAAIAIVTAELHAGRSALQDRLDAAVLAGAGSGGAEADRIDEATRNFNGNAPTSGLQTKLSTPSTEFTVSGDILHGVARSTLANDFSKIIGDSFFKIEVTAAAQRSTIPVCILGLNNLDNGAFDINGNPAFNAENCAVQANSGSTRAMTQEGNSPAKAGRWGVSGGADTNGFSPAPVEGASKIADPYAQLPFPAHDACTGKEKALVIKENTTLSPGTYCGGVEVTGDNTHVDFAPGVYVMVNGPLLMRGNATASGTEVTVAFTGADSTLRLWGNASLDLTSPKTGVYANMQFLQDGNDANGRGAWVSIGGSATDSVHLKYDGVAYFPTQNFWVYGNVTLEANSPSLVLVADKIWFQGSADVHVTNKNSRNLSVSAVTEYAGGVRLLN
jgi:Flp pilus assembly protein TadG